jgi:hypothetical protein
MLTEMIGMSNAIAAAQHARWLGDSQRVLILIVLILASLPSQGRLYSNSR